MKSIIAWSLGLALLTSCSSRNHHEKKMVTKSSLTEITHENVQNLISAWPESSRTVANTLIQKYGLPQGVTNSMLMWRETGPFKRSVVYKEEVSHNFPSEHMDVLEQVIDYKVPVAKMNELAKFDGSIVVDRTRGELAYRSNSEEMNILAFNLSNEIIKGKLSAQKARKEYSTSAQAFMMGNSNRYTSGLGFSPDVNTGDADKATLRLRPMPSAQAQEAAPN